MTHRFHPGILREYDIRGIFGETLGEADARAVGRGFATEVRRAGGRRIAVGRDGRLSSPALEAALVEGLVAGGVDVVRIGLGPTPMLYFAEASQQELDGGIQVTGSHNPPDHNGFKLVLQGRPFFGARIAALGRAAAAGEWSQGQGTVTERDVLPAYVDRLVADLDGLAPGSLAGLRMAWDAGNGAAGPAMERLAARLPGEHILLHAGVDGRFPNHHPDPTIPANLADLRAAVLANHLDFGVAFDGDGDRIGVVDGDGAIVWGDQLIAIFAEDLLRERPGATIVADVKASQTLFDRIAALGGVPVMGESGHSLVKSRMKATGALLGGEMSGHIFFAHRFFGHDDALLAAVRLIAATRRLGRSVAQLRSVLPAMVSTPELRFAVPEARKFAAVAEVRARLEAAGAKVNAIDGVRVTTADGWWLLRASNTQDMLVARAESASQEGLDRLVAAIDAQLAASGLARGAPANH